MTDKKKDFPEFLWHFTNGKLRGGEPLPKQETWLKLQGKIVPCSRGLHASPTPWDALQYAPGNVLHQVKLGGIVVANGEPIDKYAASQRMILKTIDIEDIMRRFACDQALSVIHLWNPPQIVVDYLKTCDESKRAAAWDAAWDAASAAARAAAWDAARAAASDEFNRRIYKAFGVTV